MSNVDPAPDSREADVSVSLTRDGDGVWLSLDAWNAYQHEETAALSARLDARARLWLVVQLLRSLAGGPRDADLRPR